MTTSEDEDNDSEPDEIDPEAEIGQPKKQPPKGDVIRTLIERDDNLLTRDL